MSWNEKNKQWHKMVRGKRMFVSCSTLAALFPPLPPELWTKTGSYQQANLWLESNLDKTLSFTDRCKAWAIANDKKELDAIENSDDDIRFTMAVARDYGIIIPEGVDKQVLQELFGDRQVWVDRLARQDDLTTNLTLGYHIDEFIRLHAVNARPVSHKEVKNYLLQIKKRYGSLDARKVTRDWAKEIYNEWAQKDCSSTTKKKRWQTVQRLITHLVDEGIINNFKMKDLFFKVVPKKIVAWDTTLVKTAIAALPERLQVFAWLGLNCSMTNTDMGNMTKDMVQGDYLTRRRIKTGEKETVPTVTYKLWGVTKALLEKYKSNHDNLWFLSSNGTPIVTQVYKDGKSQLKDLIGNWWRKSKCQVPISKFRNIATQKLLEHETHGRCARLFLGHSPQSTMSRHYGEIGQGVFDGAVDWLGKQFFISW